MLTEKSNCMATFTPRPSGAQSAIAASVIWLLRIPNTAAFLLCSIAVLLPCFWHRHIIAGDLSSHIYNAWLANLIQYGRLTSLYLRPQFSNILFDWTLSALLRHFSPLTTVRIACSIAVLTFFWGAFSLISAAAKRPAWSLAPLLAMFTYGIVFNFGFFNMFLSVAFSLFALAILWAGKRWDFLLLMLIVPLTFVAHPLGTAFVVSFGIYLLLLRVSGTRIQVVLSVAAFLLFYLARVYAVRHLPVLPARNQYQFFAGFEQTILFGTEYESLALIALGAAAIMVVLELRAWRENFAAVRPWVLAYLLLAGCVAVVPEGFHMQGQLGLMGLMPARLSLYSAVFVCCLLSLCKPRAWHPVTFLGLAVVYFSFLYTDTARFDRLAAKTERAVQQFSSPPRVIQNVLFTNNNLFTVRFIEQACIQHCWIVNNYEILSGQFRIRAHPGSPYTLRSEDWVLLDHGLYRVKAEDLPLKEIHRCGPAMEDVCIGDLREGDLTGEAMYRALANSRYARNPSLAH